MRKKLFALFTALLALTLCMALFAACGGGEEEPEEPVAFSAPSDLAVDGSGVVTWSAVDGAVSYTLRVNQTEFANAVSPFDLHVSAADALVSGGAQNSIAVRTDAAGDRPASAYSSTVPYTFYTADETAANAFSAQVAAIGSDPSANADAVAAAKEAYSALTTGAAALAEDAVEALVSLDAARFVYLVGQIGTPVTLESSTAIVVAQAYYATLLDNTADGVAAAKTTLDAADAALDEAAASIRSEFGELVDAVSIAESFRGTQIDAAETAYQTALTRYGSYTSAQQAAVEELYAALQGKKTTLDAAAAAEFAAYEDLVAAVAGEVTAADSATDLSAAITAAESAFNSMADYTKSENNVTEVDASVTAAKTTLTQWQSAIASALSALDTANALAVNVDDMTSTEAEALYASLTAAQTAYNDYAAYVKSDTDIISAYGTLTGNITSATDRISAIATGFADRVDTAIEGAEATLTSYNALQALVTEYNAFGTMTKEAAATAKASLDAKIAELLAVAVDEAEDVRIVVSESTTGYLQIALASYNLLGDAIEATHSVTATVNEVAATVEHTAQGYAHNYKIPFASVAAADSTPVTIVYTIDEEEPVTVVLSGYNASGSVIYFGDPEQGDDGFASMVTNATGAVNAPAASDASMPVYYDVYLASDIALGSGRNADIIFYGAPIAEGINAGVNGADITTLADLYHAIAVANPALVGQELSVKVLAYQLTGDAESGYTYSRMNGASVSETLELALTAEDAKEPLTAPFAGSTNYEDGSVLIMAAAEAGSTQEQLIAQFNAAATALETNETFSTYAQVVEHLNVAVGVYENVGTDGVVELGDLVGYITHAAADGNTNLTSEFMERELYSLAGEADANAYAFLYYFEVKPESEYAAYFTRSAASGAGDLYEAAVDGTISSERVVSYDSASGYLQIMRNESDGTTRKAATFFADSKIEYVEMILTKDSETIHFYIFYVDGNYYLTDSATVGETAEMLSLNGAGDSYCMVSDFESWVQNNVEGMSNFSLVGYQISTKLHVEEGYYDGTVGAESNKTEAYPASATEEAAA